MPRTDKVGRIFGVGAAKTGTHSIAALFEGSGLVAAHEPNDQALIELILDRADNKIDPAAFPPALRAILDHGDIAINVSQLNGYVIQDLHGLYPDARYILTVRDAEGWVRSLVNHVVTRNHPGDAWDRFRRLRFARGLPLRPEDRWLEDKGFFGLDCLLDYWQAHTLAVLATVPEPQLCVVPTTRIGAYKTAIYDFVGLTTEPAATDDHAYRGTYTDDLEQLPAAYVEERCAFYSDGLMRAARTIASPDQLALLTEALYPSGGYHARDETVRIATAESLMANRSTDLGRWAHVATETDARWDGRAALAASMMTDQTSVLDLGCGAMVLERCLPRGVRYIPSDCIRRDDRTLVCDLNTSALPDVDAACVVALGLLEYIHDVPGLLRMLGRRFEVMVCSYIPRDTVGSIDVRRATGWVNDYAITELESLMAEAGFAVVRKQRYLDKAWLWRVRKA